MPTYTVQYQGKQYEIQGSRPPTEQDMAGLVSGQANPQPQQPGFSNRPGQSPAQQSGNVGLDTLGSIVPGIKGAVGMGQDIASLVATPGAQKQQQQQQQTNDFQFKAAINAANKAKAAGNTQMQQKDLAIAKSIGGTQAPSAESLATQGKGYSSNEQVIGNGLDMLSAILFAGSSGGKTGVLTRGKSAVEAVTKSGVKNALKDIVTKSAEGAGQVGLQSTAGAMQQNKSAQDVASAGKTGVVLGGLGTLAGVGGSKILQAVGGKLTNTIIDHFLGINFKDVLDSKLGKAIAPAELRKWMLDNNVVGSVEGVANKLGSIIQDSSKRINDAVQAGKGKTIDVKDAVTTFDKALEPLYAMGKDNEAANIRKVADRLAEKGRSGGVSVEQAHQLKQFYDEAAAWSKDAPATVQKAFRDARTALNDKLGQALGDAYTSANRDYSIAQDVASRAGHKSATAVYRDLFAAAFGGVPGQAFAAGDQVLNNPGVGLPVAAGLNKAQKVVSNPTASKVSRRLFSGALGKIVGGN